MVVAALKKASLFYDGVGLLLLLLPCRFFFLHQSYISRDLVWGMRVCPLNWVWPSEFMGLQQTLQEYTFLFFVLFLSSCSLLCLHAVVLDEVVERGVVGAEPRVEEAGLLVLVVRGAWSLKPGVGSPEPENLFLMVAWPLVSSASIKV